MSFFVEHFFFIKEKNYLKIYLLRDESAPSTSSSGDTLLSGSGLLVSIIKHYKREL